MNSNDYNDGGRPVLPGFARRKLNVLLTLAETLGNDSLKLRTLDAFSDWIRCGQTDDLEDKIFQTLDSAIRAKRRGDQGQHGRDSQGDRTAPVTSFEQIDDDAFFDALMR